MRMNDAEKKAAALPPKLTVPMILFFLPVLFAIILGPAGIQVSQQVASSVTAKRRCRNSAAPSGATNQRSGAGRSTGPFFFAVAPEPMLSWCCGLSSSLSWFQAFC